MQDENYEHNKSREEYYYLEKKGLCKFFKMLLASFFGTLLALCLFRALHKPPIMFMPPVGPYAYNQPYSGDCMQRWRQHPRMIAPEEFKDNRAIYQAPSDINKNPAPVPQSDNISDTKE